RSPASGWGGGAGASAWAWPASPSASLRATLPRWGNAWGRCAPRPPRRAASGVQTCGSESCQPHPPILDSLVAAANSLTPCYTAGTQTTSSRSPLGEGNAASEAGEVQDVCPGSTARWAAPPLG